MSVSSTTTKVSYSGDGSQTVFAYTFKIFAAADLRVIERASNGTETLKTLTTHYTVSGVGTDGGGNVTFGTAPASGVTVIIKRNLGLTQGTDYIDNDPFPAESHEDALDRLTFIAQNIQEQVDRCIKASETNTLSGAEFTIGASDRANKIFAFDSSGDVSITQEIGTFRGSDATITTAAYNVRDLIKSTTSAQLNNIYLCKAASSVGDLLTNTSKFELIVDAAAAATSVTNAAASATAAAASATQATTNGAAQVTLATAQVALATTQAANAASSATDAQGSEDEAEAWAQKTNGEAVTGQGYSSKAWATGGTGVTDSSGAGSAKEWATDTTNTCDGTEFSAKEYAIGSQAGNTNGSAKQWALGGGGSYSSNTAVSGSLYSAKYWAEQAAASASDFDNKYHGPQSSDPTTDPDGSALEAGDLYFNTTSNVMRVYDGASWDDVVTSTTGFATAGFSIAMSIAL
jgi:hypothetical protein